MAEPTATLERLPDELILEVVNYLGCILSHEPQSTAFKKKQEETARQRENHQRQLALHALCLTSHRFRRITTPMLYTSFVSAATSYSFKPLQLFHRTVCNAGPAAGLQNRLAEYLLYVENRLSDYLGNSLYKDTESDDAILMVTEYFRLLADIVNHAPNLQHLTVVSLEANEVSFWKHILPNDGNQSLTTIPNHGFQKLQSLSFQTHTKAYRLDSPVASFRRICSAMTAAPMLTDLRASGVMTNDTNLPLSGAFTRVQRMEITECVLDFAEMSELWAACNGLRHIICEWAFLDHERGSPAHLYEGLLRHENSLETLHLDMREVRMGWPERLGSLQSFAALQSLGLCERALGIELNLLDCPTVVPQEGISGLIPQTLKSFALFLRYGHIPGFDAQIDEATALFSLAEQSAYAESDLRVVTLRYGRELNAPILTKAFDTAGVHLELVNEGKAKP
ncbi:hypothetical protein CC86DRAFT_148977 [Ophiobolus disseminans]|uniref:F-box domain-containing protein n=1 Tax=Ophiobolus disseminans TaxID=1469910 RepID=A0A6A6ZFZ7_9PLEO|nr:hypothetical protein CC86DRAFT_148977 [Ophiobolus disseminans]